MNEPGANGKRSIYCEAKPEYFESTFNALVRGVWSAGGDGDGALFNRWCNYKDVAKLFEEYEVTMNDGTKRKMKDMYKIHDDPDNDGVLFTDESNENIWIAAWSDKRDMKHWTDIVIIR